MVWAMSASLWPERTGTWFFRRCSLIPQWPSCEPVLQQIKHVVESSLEEVHLRCLRQALQSDPPAKVCALGTDLRAEPGQGLKLLSLLHQGPDLQQAEWARLGKLLEADLA
jgi:hypothetical protein